MRASEAARGLADSCADTVAMNGPNPHLELLD